MPRYEYRLVDVFTRSAFGGNPLAVFPHAEGMDPGTMQRIAGELNLSETTFVLPPRRADCDVRVRIFTPRRELPMAGHPTVGTAYVLDHGEKVTFEENVGPVEVDRVLTPEGAPAWRMAQPRPVLGIPLDDPTRAAVALGLGDDDLRADLPVASASCGVTFLLVPLRTLDALARATLRTDAWREVVGKAKVLGAMPFVVTGEGTVRCRMFAPDLGVTEDPATGSACGPLGGYLVRHGVVRAGRPARVRCEQGMEMGRPGTIWVEVEGKTDALGAVRVAGECAPVGGGWLDV